MAAGKHICTVPYSVEAFLPVPRKLNQQKHNEEFFSAIRERNTYVLSLLEKL
jgi:hypothetical protein